MIINLFFNFELFILIFNYLFKLGNYHFQNNCFKEYQFLYFCNLIIFYYLFLKHDNFKDFILYFKLINCHIKFMIWLFGYPILVISFHFLIYDFLDLTFYICIKYLADQYLIVLLTNQNLTIMKEFHFLIKSSHNYRNLTYFSLKYLDQNSLKYLHQNSFNYPYQNLVFNYPFLQFNFHFIFFSHLTYQMKYHINDILNHYCIFSISNYFIL